MLAGDLVLDVEDADHWLSGIAPALRAADVTIGHLEVPHTRRGTELAGDVPAPGADPDNLSALARAGVTAVTLAGNHIADCGPQGIADTVAMTRPAATLHMPEQARTFRRPCPGADPLRHTAARIVELQLRGAGERLGYRHRRGLRLFAHGNRRRQPGCTQRAPG